MADSFLWSSSLYSGIVLSTNEYLQAHKSLQTVAIQSPVGSRTRNLTQISWVPNIQYYFHMSTVPARCSLGRRVHSLAGPLWKEEQRQQGDTHAVERKWKWGIQGGEEMSPPRDSQLLVLLGSGASFLIPAEQWLWGTFIGAWRKDRHHMQATGKVESRRVYTGEESRLSGFFFR